LSYRTPRRGDKLEARHLAAIQGAARAAQNIAGGQGVSVLSAPAGISVTRSPAVVLPRDCILAKLTSAATAPMYAVVEIYDQCESLKGPQILSCRRPSSYGLSRLGVLRLGAAQNDVVPVQVRGVCPAMIKVAGDFSGGGRAGSKYEDYGATLGDALGPLFVLADAGPASTAGYRYGIVRITSERGDYIRVVKGSQPYGGEPTAALWFADGFKGSMDVYGKLTIEET